MKQTWLKKTVYLAQTTALVLWYMNSVKQHICEDPEKSVTRGQTTLGVELCPPRVET